MKKKKSIWFVKESIMRGRYSFNPDKFGWGNGYVALPPNHPFFKKSYDYINDFIDIHYGLTYAEVNKTWEEAPVGWYIIGFDTAHYDDTIQKWPKESVELEAKKLLQQVNRYNNRLYYLYKLLKYKFRK